MRLDHEFTVPVPAAQAWPVLLDIDRIAPCMPGASVTKVDGDDFEGTVKVKVGPITVTYAGSASFVHKDEATRLMVIEARAKETRGSGTATARITAQITDGDPGSARVAVSTDLSITGKPAQFGRGVMNDVGAKLVGRFADCLAAELASDPALAAPAPAPAGAVPASEAAGAPAQSQDTAEVGSAPVTTPADTATAAAAAAGLGTTGVVAGTAPTDSGDLASIAPAGEDAAGLAYLGASGAATGTGGNAAAAGTAEAAASGTTADTAPASVLDASPRAARQEAEPLDLMEAAGGAVAKRAVPAAAAVALLAILVAALRRRTR